MKWWEVLGMYKMVPWCYGCNKPRTAESRVFYTWFRSGWTKFCLTRNDITYVTSSLLWLRICSDMVGCDCVCERFQAVKIDNRNDCRKASFDHFFIVTHVHPYCFFIQFRILVSMFEIWDSFRYIYHCYRFISASDVIVVSVSNTPGNMASVDCVSYLVCTFY